MIFCATCAASEARLTSGSTTTNSSPPMRQMVSPIAQLLHQALRHFLQQRVAHGVAERVVDGLEAVEVDEHHRGVLAVAVAERERLRQPVLQQAAVGQPGERVVVGEVLGARLRLLQLGGALGHRALERRARPAARAASASCSAVTSS